MTDLQIEAVARALLKGDSGLATRAIEAVVADTLARGQAQVQDHRDLARTAGKDAMATAVLGMIGDGITDAKLANMTVYLKLMGIPSRLEQAND